MLLSLCHQYAHHVPSSPQGQGLSKLTPGSLLLVILTSPRPEPVTWEHVTQVPC